jgi:TolB-like protein
VEPAAADVRRQLDRILASEGFVNADRMAGFLRYIVDRALAGEGDQIKEYVVGVEVFGRSADYDPRVDSLVRVEARRLRTKLDEYYAGPGRDDPVVIELRRGTYVPQFQNRDARVAAGAPSVERSLPTRVWRQPSFVLVAAAAGLLVTVLAGLRGAVWTETGRSAPAVSIVVLPLAEYSPAPEDEAFAAKLTDGITSELARAGGLSVISHTTAMQLANGEHRTIREIGSALDIDVVMEGRVARTDGRVNVDIRLVNARTDRKFWVRQFSGEARNSRTLEQQIATAIVPAALTVESATR